MENQSKTCIIILGMHRSGTSLMAGCLRLLGVQLGDTLFEPRNKANEKGHFEHSDILQINEAILSKLGSSYDDIKGLPEGWEQNPEMVRFKNQIRSVIERDFNRSPLFGIKEPRIGLLLPLYKDVLRELGIRTVFVIMKRKEIEILESLKARNQFAFSKSLDLIAKYRLNIERYTQGESKVYIAFDDLVNYPRFCMEKIRDTLQVALKPYDTFERDIITFIDPRLKHHNLDDQTFLQELVREMEKVPRRDAEIQAQKASIERLKSSIGKLEATNLAQEKKQQEADAIFRQKQELAKEKFQDYKEAMVREHELEKRVIAREYQLEREMLVKEYHRSHEEFVKEKDIEFEGAAQKSRHQMEVMAKAQHNEISRLKTAHEKEVANFKAGREREVGNLKTVLFHEQEYRKALERSLTFKVLRFYQKLVDAVMPEGWFVRRWYNSLVELNQRALNREKANPGAVALARKKLEKFKGVDVLFINHEESRTGAPRILFDIISYVGSHTSHSFAVVSKARGSMHMEFLKYFPDILYPADLYPGVSKFERAKRVLQATLPKLVYVNSLLAYEYAFEAKKMGIKVVFHMHELGSALQRVLSAQERATFGEFADTVIAASREVSNHLIRDTQCDPSQIQVIHEFIDVDRTRKLAQVPPDAPIHREGTVFVSIGTASKRKGTDLWFQAAKQVLAEGKKATFVWVGEDLNQLPEITGKQDDEHIVFLGEKENPFPYIEQADALILPSREDPFPLVVLEAMALGKPVIVFSENVGSKEVVDDNTGIVVKETSAAALAEAVKLFMDSRQALQNKASIYGREKIRMRYDAAYMLPKITEVIEWYVGKKTKEFVPASVAAPAERSSALPDIFFIRGFAKSGTNWVGNLMNLHPDLYALGEFHLSRLQVLHENLFPYSQTNNPKQSEIVSRHLEQLAYDTVLNGFHEETQKEVKLIGERTPEKIEPLAIRGKRIIWIMRDGRDVLVSWIYHFLTIRLEKEDPLDPFPLSAKKRALFDEDRFYFKKNPEALLDDEGVVRMMAKDWSEFIQEGFVSLQKSREGKLEANIHAIKYEDLHKKTVPEAKKMYAFLGVDPIKAAPLDRFTLPGFSADMTERPDFFYRKGIVGDWKHYFTEETKRWFKEEAGKTLIDAGYETDLNW